MSDNVGIVTVSDDLHACIIATELKSRHGVNCSVFETDKISFKGDFEWKPGLSDGSSYLTNNLRQRCEIESLTTFWWRRFAQEQAEIPIQGLPHERDLINKDCRAALSGMFDCLPEERFVSSRAATDRASNKLLQLRTALKHGLRIPQTLISSNRAAILDFVNSQRSCILKPLGSTSKAIVFTTRVTGSEISRGSVTASPAIYQECIEGSVHLRVNVFGEQVYAFQIKANDLDWRRVLSTDVELVKLDSALQKQLVAFVAEFGLSMGIIDMKVDPTGEPIFLEINPQGQFLFLEPLTGLNLIEIFADFLVGRAIAGKCAPNFKAVRRLSQPPSIAPAAMH